MRSDWSLEDLISCWTLDEADWRLLANKSGATRLGFAVLLKFLELEGRFPADGAEVPSTALDYIAGQVKVDRSELDGYWSGRAVKYHRAQIRFERGFRESTLDDERRMIVWLAGGLCPVELDDKRLRADLLARFREQQIEPPGASRIDRIVGSGRAVFERRFTATNTARLSTPTIAALERLIPAAAGDEEVSTAGLLVELKRDPGKASLNTILEEINKLGRVRSLGLPADLFEDCSEKLLAAWRARAAATYPAHLRAMPEPIRITLLAALCWSRTAEITDALVDLLIDVVDKIRVRAENRVEKALVADLKRVRGKQGLLFALAAAAVEHPDETVRQALFPVVPEATLRQLVKEAKATERLFRAQVRTEIRGSYSNHYRRMLPRILEALEFRCANTLYRPVMGRARVAAPPSRHARTAALLPGRRARPDRPGAPGPVARRGDRRARQDRADPLQEISMLAMHLLQSSLVLVNTLIIQQILAEPEWVKRLTARDRKALTALTWAHINPYGTFHIDMNTHLDLGPGTPTAKAA